MGIPEDAFVQIFEDFKQLDGGATREVGGTGLGLSIAKRLIELQGGTITVKSQMGVGSSFTITLPMKLRSTAPPEDASTLASPAGASTETPHSQHKVYQEGSKAITILSVDDDPTNQAVIRKLLSPYFGIIQAMSGSEALDILHNSPTPPDFILLDVMMPKMSGLEVCERVREKYPACDLPIIMVSAKNKPENIVEGLSKGANDYIGKPVNKHELLARIRAQLMICHTCKLARKKLSDGNSARDDIFVCDSCRSSLTNKSITGTFTYGPRSSSQELLLSLLHDPSNCMEILNYVPMMVTLYDTQGKVVLRNMEAKRMLEHIEDPDAVQVNNQSFVSHVHDRAVAEQILADVMRGTRVEMRVEVPINGSPAIEAAGKHVHSLHAGLLALSNPSKGSQGVFVLVAEEDVSQTANMARDNERLKTLNTQKDELISDLAHNLKSPLNGVVGLLEAVLDEVGVITGANPSKTSTIPAMIELLSASALRFSRTIDQIADYSGLEESGEAGINVNTPIDISEAFDEASALFAPLLKIKKVEMTKSFATLPNIQSRHQKIVQLLGYLLESAAQFSESRRVTVSAHHDEASRFVIVKLTDSMTNLSDTEIAHLFDPSQGVSKGFLSPLLASALIRGFGGDVTAQALAKGGCVISAQIPIVTTFVPHFHHPLKATASPPIPNSSNHHDTVTPAALPTPTTPMSPRPATPRKPVILSVDDDSIHQVVICNILAQAGFEVVQAGDGIEALEYLADTHRPAPDLVLLDNMMPRMNGAETCRRIREKFSDKYAPLRLLLPKSFMFSYFISL